MDPIEDGPLRQGNAFCAHPTFGGVPLKNLAPPVDIDNPSPAETICSSVSSRSSHTPPTLVLVVLRISPSHDGGPSGFVYLDVHKLNEQAATMAYFANTGRVTTVLVDCSIGTLAWSLGQKVVLSFNGYWGKRSEYSLAKPKDAT